MLDVQEIAWALAFALFSAGSSIAAKIAIIAITTSNSIREKQDCIASNMQRGFEFFFTIFPFLNYGFCSFNSSFMIGVYRGFEKLLESMLFTSFSQRTTFLLINCSTFFPSSLIHFFSFRFFIAGSCKSSNLLVS